MLLPGETIQSQYSASPVIRTLAESFRIRIAPDIDIEKFFNNIFNIETAQGYGLDVWGRILAMPRGLYVDAVPECFGFNEADFDPFDTSPFHMGKRDSIQYLMPDTPYRKLLLWKAMANIATADLGMLNLLLAKLFPGEDIVIHEWGVMAIELYIFFQLEPWQRTILLNYGLLARGAGVELNWVEIPQPCFGFEETEFYEPFDEAPFWNIYPQLMEVI